MKTKQVYKVAGKIVSKKVFDYIVRNHTVSLEPQQAERPASEASHTPTPWKIARQGTGSLIYSNNPRGEATTYIAQGLDKIDAAFIVNAVNCHDELMRGLRIALLRTAERCDQNETERLLREIIGTAEWGK